MNAPTLPEALEIDTPAVAFELNGRAVSARAGESLLQVAKREGVAIPHLCFKEGMAKVGNCRTCMVEIAGERALAPSCCRAPAAGMKVSSDSERVVKAQKLVLELLLSDVPERSYTRHSELDDWARALAVGKPRFPSREAGGFPRSGARNESATGRSPTSPSPHRRAAANPSPARRA